MSLPVISERQAGRSGGNPERRRRLIIWGAVTLFVLLLIFGTKPALHWFKSSRAAQLAVTANSLAAAGKTNEAAEKYRAALQLDPSNYLALQGAAQLASRLGRPEAVDLWEQVVRSRRATVNDKQQYAEQLLLSDRPRPAAAMIDALLESAPDARTFELASRYWRSAGDIGKAIQFARLAAKNAPNDERVRVQLAEVLAASIDPSERAEARKILWELSARENRYRRPAIEALASSPELDQSERRKVLELLGTLSPPNIKDTLLAADLRLQLETDNPQQIYDDTIGRCDRANVSELAEVGRWLNVHQQAERVLSLIPLQEALKNTQLLLVRLDALAQLQRWNEIDAVLCRNDLNLDPSVVECFRARVAQKQNAALEADMHWNQAISLAARNPSTLRTVAEFAEQSEASAAALRAYDWLAKFPEYAGIAYRGIERLSGRANDLAVQRAAAEKIRTLTGKDPNAIAQFAYVSLLAGTDVEVNAAAVQKLVQQYPSRLVYRVAAALGYLRQRDAPRALEQFKGPAGAPPIDWNRTPPAWRAVYAAVLLANEQTSAAEEIIKTIPLDQLNAEERALIQRK